MEENKKRNIDGDISRLSNNYSLLKVEFENFEEGKSKFKSRDDILNLMLRNQSDLRDAKKAKTKSLKPDNKKNNSNE